MTPDRPRDNPCPYTCEYPGCEWGAHKPKVNWNGDDTAILCTAHINSEIIEPLIERLQAAEERAAVFTKKSKDFEQEFLLADRLHTERCVELDALHDGIRQVIKDRASGDFAPILPKLRALLAEDTTDG